MSQIDIKNLLIQAIQQSASDIHLVVNKPPMLRIHGELTSLHLGIMRTEDIEDLIFPMLSEIQKEIFHKQKDLDFSYFFMKECQTRINLHIEKGNLAATIRIMPNHIESPEALGLPPVLKDIVRRRKGLMIIAGTAGCGKSTTLTSLVDLINRERKCKIIMIEDPIEFIHESQQSLIIQREVGSDTNGFATALKYALRQDPDVVVVGEMRDHESIAMALTTAETGHLVLTTLHAPDAVETINRIIDVYPPGHREQVCMQLAANLIAVVHQTLVPCKNSPKRVLATEVMIATLAVRNLIRRQSFFELRGQMESAHEVGMHSLEQCLSQMFKENIITVETAREYAKYPDMLQLPKELAVTQKGRERIPRYYFSAKRAEKKMEKVFIVDFNQEDREQMNMIVRDFGYEQIFFASQAIEALENIYTVRPEIVILGMSSFYNMDSFELCRRIRAIENFNPKLIMLTVHMRHRDQEHAKEVGVDDFVLKTPTYELFYKALVKFD